MAARPPPAWGFKMNVYTAEMYAKESGTKYQVPGTESPVSECCARLLIVLGLFVTVLTGCSQRQDLTAATRPYTDDLGREVEVPVEPERVVTLAPNLTEIMFAAGAGDRLAAVTTADNYPPEVDQIARVGAFPLDHELIVAQSPDLVLATDQVNSPLDIEPISDLGIPSVFLQFKTVGDVISAVRKVGSLMGSTAEAESAANALDARWERLRTRAGSVEYRPSVLLLVGYDVLYAFGSESYTTEMIEAAGGISTTGELPGQSAALSDEFVLGSAPEIIIGTFGPEFTIDALLERHPTWDALAAVRNNHVYTVDRDLVLRPGPRVIDGAERMAAIVALVVEETVR